MTNEIYTPLPFVGARGIPQTVPFDAAGHKLRITLVAGVSDVPALRSLPQTANIFDGRHLETTRATFVPENERSLYISPSHESLSAAVLRPFVVVREGETIVGSRPVLTGTPLRIGNSSPLLVELLFETLTITSGSVTQPGDFGAVIDAGIRVLTNGTPRFEKPTTQEEEDLYGSLA
jgi:hypothetical protein